MASLRRNNNMATDGATPKFLYTILKQLDLRSIDWNQVADSLGITNGHAARMRFSRFKQQMEGIPPAPRKPRSAATHQKKPKREKVQPKREIEPKESNELLIKPESRDDMAQLGADPIVHPVAFVKDEPIEEVYAPHVGSVGSMEWMEHRQDRPPNFLTPYEEEEVDYQYPEPSLVKQEPSVKIEPGLAPLKSSM